MRRESAAILLKANQIDPDIPIVRTSSATIWLRKATGSRPRVISSRATAWAPDEPLYLTSWASWLTEHATHFFEERLQWIRAQIDRTMQEAFRARPSCAPKNIAFALSLLPRSFYDSVKDQTGMRRSKARRGGRPVRTWTRKGDHPPPGRQYR